MGSVCVWLSHQQGCIPGNRKRCDQEREKGGHHSYRLSQRNTSEENLFFYVLSPVFTDILKSFCVP